MGNVKLGRIPDERGDSVSPIKDFLDYKTAIDTAASRNKDVHLEVIMVVQAETRC